MKFPLICCIFN